MQLRKIKESGFLNEFLMSKYNNCLIGPKDYIFNFDGYKNGNLRINLI